jgi:hypothetical protein
MNSKLDKKGKSCCSSCDEDSDSDFEVLFSKMNCGKKELGVNFSGLIPAEKRKLTFFAWPKCLQYIADDLVEAGFFYNGESDHVTCFCCGIAIKDWECCSNPWEDHAAFSPKCKFLIMTRGQQFINEIQRKDIRTALVHKEF